MNRSPLVSVLIPVYNRERFIGATIRSALEQTCTDIEVVVSDNCSTDSSWNIISEFADRDPRIRCFRNEKNIGPVRNWIAAARHARGVYSKILWSDDLMAPGFVASAVDAFRRQEDIAFVYSSIAFIDADGKTTGRPEYRYGRSGSYPVSRFVTGALLDDRRIPVSPGCALFRTEDLRSGLLTDFPNRHGFDLANIAIGNDLLLFLLSTRDRTRFYHISEVQNYFRMHSGSISEQEGRGKLYAFYKLAKCWFAATHLKPEHHDLFRAMNAQIGYYLGHGAHSPAAFRSVADFYPPGYSGPTDYALTDNIRMVVRELVNRVRSPKRAA